MKKTLAALLPNWILDRIAKVRYHPSNSTLGKGGKQVFTNIYRQNSWGTDESRSGPGSTTNLSEGAVAGLKEFFRTNDISSIVDLPCGEFGWMAQVLNPNISYLGGDIVEELIALNKESETGRVKFTVLDLLTDEIPKADVLLVRDCLVHLSYNDIKTAYRNIKHAKFKFLITTTFTDLTLNFDIRTGDWRPLNLCLPPFNLPPPKQLIKESVEPGFEKDFRGKSLGVWKVEDLASLRF